MYISNKTYGIDKELSERIGLYASLWVISARGMLRVNDPKKKDIDDMSNFMARLEEVKNYLMDASVNLKK